MELLNTGNELSDDDISRFEAEFELTLPHEDRAFLLRHNGGVPEPGWYSMNDEYEDEISQFFVLGASNRHTSLADKVATYRDWILPAYLPFADCAGGDVLCLSLREAELGAVYHWNHGLANRAGEPYEDNMTRLANSLSEFVDGVTTLEEFEDAALAASGDVVPHVVVRPWWKFWSAKGERMPRTVVNPWWKFW